MKNAALLLIALAFSSLAVAQMYKWVDKDGKTHYTDTPPPPESKALAAPRSGAAPTSARDGPAPAARQDDKGGRSQGSFNSEEEAALRAVCVIYLLETMTCKSQLQRFCPLDELVKGIGGDSKKGLKRDPRNDPNYEYRGRDPRRGRGDLGDPAQGGACRVLLHQGQRHPL